jgi:hypothetical protein
MSIIWVGTGRFNAYIGPVQDYIDRVVAADVAAGNTMGLEAGVRDAYDVFIRACLDTGELGSSGGVLSQANSIIKIAPILAGARTLSGALVTLVGAAPTNNFFGPPDYNRRTGLLGDGSGRWLNLNRLNDADPQNSQHLAVSVSTLGTSVAMSMALDSSDPGSSHIGAASVRSRNTTPAGRAMQAGFNGISRNNAASYEQRVGGSTEVITQASQVPSPQNLTLFRSGSFYGTHRIAFYSVGEALNLTPLDARLSALMSGIAGAIP